MASLVETSMRAFVKVYHRRPAFMQIWMRGRTNAAVYDYGRHHNKRITENLLAFAVDAGLVDSRRYSEAEVQAIGESRRRASATAPSRLAFERDPHGDEFLIDQAVELVTGYLARVTADPR
ncbi:hypothetical protein G5V59_15895 [Nocardioides sp. W3-2-3]|nr:hypothetical protein [Nocardioides convexus]